MLVYSTSAKVMKRIKEENLKKLRAEAFDMHYYMSDSEINICYEEDEYGNIHDIYDEYQRIPAYAYLAEVGELTESEIKELLNPLGKPYLLNYVNFMAKEIDKYFYLLKQHLLEEILRNLPITYRSIYTEDNESHIIYIETDNYQFSFHDFSVNDWNKESLYLLCERKGDEHTWNCQHLQNKSVDICKEYIYSINN